MISFKDLREKVSIESIAEWLGLELKRSGEQLRGPCPIHGGGARALVVTPEKGLFYNFCSECQKGGDGLELVVHTQGVDHKTAARKIADQFVNGSRTPPEEPFQKGATSFRSRDVPPTFDPEAYLEKLEYEHEAVQALGIPATVAQELGIGFAKKGIHAGRVVFPLRFDDGSILGFAGFNADKDPPLKLPKL